MVYEAPNPSLTTKRVWKWSVESGKGKAWLYFVFAICQWLPTNYRMNYSLDGPRKICNLCLCNSMDTMDHLLQCPALAKEHLNLKQQVDAKLKFLDIPYASAPTKPRDHELRKSVALRGP